MMKKILIPALILLAVSSCRTSENTLPDQEPVASQTRVIEAEGFSIEFEQIETGIDIYLYAIESGSGSRMIAGGSEGKLYASSPDGKEWHEEYQSPEGHTFRAIASGVYRFPHYWVAAADGAIYFTKYSGLNWTTLYSDPHIDFHAVGLDRGRLNRDLEFYIGGYGEGTSRLFEYYLWDDSYTSWTSFEEYPSMAKGAYTSISGIIRAVYGVTDRGEFVNIKNVSNWTYPLIYFPYPLHAVRTMEGWEDTEFGFITYVAGENGFMARLNDRNLAQGELPDYDIKVISTGVSETIRTVAANRIYQWPEIPVCLMAGGDNGTLLVSVDGLNFTKVDIGIDWDIQDITYHEATDSFFAAGGYGQIYEIKVIMD